MKTLDVMVPAARPAIPLETLDNRKYAARRVPPSGSITIKITT
jgi:hypothetical protein